MLDWLRVTRASGLFTVASNILAALAVAIYAKDLDLRLIAVEVWLNARVAGWVVVASVLLFCAGMLWNDVADVERDRVLHPGRPIAAGRIPVTTAWVAGLLLSSGALLAASQAGARGFHAAGAVLALVLLYDFGTKGVPYLGSLTMALVRGCHAVFALLILGDEFFDRAVFAIMDVAGVVDLGARHALPSYPLLLGCYVLGLTLISELESRRGRRLELLIGGALVLVALVLGWYLSATAHWIQDLQRERRTLLLVVALLAVIALGAWIIWRFGRPFAAAVRSARRAHVGPVVATGLGGIVLFDALVATAFHPLIGLAVLLLVVPHRLATRLVRMD